ncbi:MAG: hypothetical protein IPM82_11955 [Saprospiraceae bacterium]|nr:hypothetical protein [Saprospiraceae bacterium]
MVGLKGKRNTVFDLIEKVVLNAISNFEWKPFGKTDGKEIVGKDLVTTQKTLDSLGVKVAEVQPYNPKLNIEYFQAASVLPKKLEAGQNVRLYEENGKVLGYMVVKDEPNKDDLDAQKQEIKKVKEDLKKTQQLITDKDGTISKLQEELNNIRKEQEEFRQILKSNTLESLMNQFPKRLHEKNRNKNSH